MKKYIILLLFISTYDVSFAQRELKEGDGVGGWRKYKRKYNNLLPQYEKANLHIDKLKKENDRLALINKRQNEEILLLRKPYDRDGNSNVKPNIPIPENIRPYIDELKMEHRSYANVMMQYKRKSRRYDSIYEYSFRKNIKELQKILEPLGVFSKTNEKMVTFINLTDDIFLFPTGEYELDEAKINTSKLIPIVTFLNRKKIPFMVEGNADTDYFWSNRCPTDNWDLSSLRATTIVRYLSNTCKIDSNLMTATGRGCTNPNTFVDNAIDMTTKKNRDRRVNIIIYPDLTELYKLLEEEAAVEIRTK